jgi:crotonobetainyl-CoA:carnitine CoA-transferase CaiB-like acyl-CoA transferase
MMLPLEGVRVVEFCEVAAGPFCGMLLADMGADVVKVERPEGDGMRQWPPMSGGYSENFASVNRNKRSIALDLKDPKDLATARALALSADAMIENYRPGVMKRYGLDHATLSKSAPNLVYASISAFGQTGPRAQEGGFDLTLQAIAGVMSVTGEAGGAPVKCGVPLCDFVSGLYAAFSVVCGVRKVRELEGGGHFDVSMMGATLAVAALQTSQYFGTGKDPEKLGSAHPRNAPYQAFSAADGWFAMAAGNNRLWEKVCEIAGTTELLSDPRFANSILRAQHQEALRDLLEAVFTAKPASHWLERFAAAGVPSGEINTYSQALADPQVAHLGLVEEVTLPGGARTKTVVSPVVMSGRISGVRRAPPAIGEHSDEIRAELSVDA